MLRIGARRRFIVASIARFMHHHHRFLSIPEKNLPLGVIGVRDASHI
jgi:hypothetical protein